jgi:hypothetical protein
MSTARRHSSCALSISGVTGAVEFSLPAIPASGSIESHIRCGACRSNVSRWRPILRSPDLGDDLAELAVGRPEMPFRPVVVVLSVKRGTLAGLQPFGRASYRRAHFSRRGDAAESPGGLLGRPGAARSATIPVAAPASHRPACPSRDGRAVDCVDGAVHRPVGARHYCSVGVPATDRHGDRSESQRGRRRIGAKPRGFVGWRDRLRRGGGRGECDFGDGNGR